MERNIGEVFNYGSLRLRVEKTGGENVCEGCVFYDRNWCTGFNDNITGSCSKNDRTQKEDIVFVLDKPTDNKPSANDTSVKNDIIDNKVRMDLLPWRELEEIAKVYTAGAKKYGPNQWQNLPDGYQRYKGAMLRHLTELEKGNEFDEDTGCRHAAQIAWNAIAMLHFKLKENNNG